MASPKNPTTATDTVAPPPIKPPVVDTDIFTPPPKKPRFPHQIFDQPNRPPAIVMGSLAELKKSGPPADRTLLEYFISDPVTCIRELNYAQNNPERVRLRRLIDKYAGDANVSYAWKVAKVQLSNLREKSLILSRKAEVQAQPIPVSAPPIATATQIIPPTTPPAPGSGITAKNAPKIEKWLNDFKPKFYDYLAKNKFETANDIHAFSKQFLSYLSLYRGEVAKFYLDEGVHEMLYTALGPVGNAMRSLYGANIQRKMAWMKNPLNPNAIYYYLNSLPTQAAFKVLYLPVKATWGILARGGAPLITKAIYPEWKYDPDTGPKQIIKQGYFFSPTFKLSQGINALSDGLDKLAGVGKEKTSEDFQLALKRLINAKESKNKTDIKTARQELHQLLNEHDGKFGQAIFKGGLKNLSRRLKKINKDPVSGLFALLIGTLIDLTIGLGLNLARVVTTRVLNFAGKYIPGINTLRATITEFFTSNRLLNTVRIGGTTINSFAKGVFSPTTLSSGYVGYQVGSLLTPNLYFNLYGVPINVGGAIATPIFSGAGAFYQTALNLAKQGILDYQGRLNPVGWAQEIQRLQTILKYPEVDPLEAKTAAADLKNISLKGFRPGPFTRFASWLYEHKFFRLPINGYVVGNLISPLMQHYFGWSPLTTHLVTIGVDFFWQTKAAWGQLFNQVWTKPTWTIFGKTFFTPYWRLFSLENPTSLFTKIYHRWLGFSRFGIPGPTLTFIDKPWLRFLKNSWSKVQIYARNFFNPGFFLGFSLIPLLTPALGAWAFIAGPIIGSAAWLVSTRVAAAIMGQSAAAFMPAFNSLAFAGYFISQIAGLIFFGFNIPIAWTLGWTIGLPLLGTGFQIIASAFGLSVSQVLGTFISGITHGLISAVSATGVIASGLGIWATVTSIATVAGLTVFFAYTIYAGFWIPMMEEYNAQPTSINFSLTSTCNKISDNKYRCCASFNITQDILNVLKYLNLSMDFNGTNLSINLSDPDTVTSASRDNTPLNYSLLSLLTSTNYSVDIPPTDLPVVAGSDMLNRSLFAYLSTPTDQPSTLEDLLDNSNLVNSIIPFLEILQEMAKDKLNPENSPAWTAYYVQGQEELEALLNGQQATLKKLQSQVESGNLTEAEHFLTYQLTNNPVKNPETITCSETDDRCLQYKSAVKGYFDSWPAFINQQLTLVEGLIAHPDPALLIEASASLEENFSQTEQDWKSQQQLVKKLNEIKYQLSDDDANFLADPELNVRNFTNLSEDTKIKLLEIINKYFGGIFNFGRPYYYIPQGTNYNFCAIVDYCLNYLASPPVFANCDPQPQTVCSAISANTELGSYGNAFAKSCTTFTP
ncbi:MAG: hypothetical protein V1810_00880 [Candidatus Beckwithbacteria bacterium]